MSGTAGMTQRSPMRERQARQRIWQALRVMREFTVAEIIATAEASATNTRHYLRSLAKADYVLCVRSRHSGYSGGHALWRLVRDTGPYAPRIGARGVQDPNLEPHKAPTTVTIPRSEYERALQCVHACQGMSDPMREVAALKERAP